MNSMIVLAAAPELPSTAARILAITTSTLAAAGTAAVAVLSWALRRRNAVKIARQEEPFSYEERINLVKSREHLHKLAISERKIHARAALVASILSGAMITAGLILTTLGFVSPGVSTSALAVIPGFASKLFFDRSREAKMDAIRVEREIHELLEAPRRMGRAINIARYIRSNSARDAFLVEAGKQAMSRGLWTNDDAKAIFEDIERPQGPFENMHVNEFFKEQDGESS
jgi:hypothetical protein